MTRNGVDIEAVLELDYKIRENIPFNGKFNKTSRFILPLLDLQPNSKLVSMYIKGAFYDDHSIEHDFDKPVFVLFRVKNQREKAWTEMYKTLSTKPTFIMDYYVGEQDGHSLIMFVFDLPDKWKADYELFKQGRYSKMSDAYKSKFPKIIYTASGEAKEGREWGILHKSDILKNEVVKLFINPPTSTAEDVISLRRDMDSWEEVWDAPHEIEEIYHYDQDSVTDNIRISDRIYA